MSHDEASDLLGAYALDAVDGDEFTELEEHLETCPRCRAELDSLREVAAAMGNSVEPPPEGLWSQIASRLPERQEDEEPPPMPRLVRERGPARPSGRRPLERLRPSAPHHARRTVGAIAVAAAAVAVVLGIGLVRADNKVSNLQAAQAAPSAAVTAALHGARAPGRHPRLEHARRSRRRSSSCRRGRATWSRRPCRRSTTAGPTSSGRSRGTSPISLGLLGGSPSRAAFTMAGSTRPSHLSITAEPAGGSVVPDGPDRRHRDCLTPPRSC